MLPLELWIAGIMMVSLTIYALTGGADFGGGIWDLFAAGPRAKEQRRLIADAIAPIWEANHVWLIIVVVLLFVCYPPAFAAIMTALHIPLTIMLIGIVLRGSAFVFRSYDVQTEPAERRWTIIFAGASAVTPFMLGITVGAIASGDMQIDAETGMVQTDFFSSWLAPFPFAVGLLTVTLFAFLAAIYLTVEAETSELKDDFRRRGLLAAGAVFVSAWLAFFLAADGAPLVYDGLISRWWSLPFHSITGLMAVLAVIALWRRRFRFARVFAGAQVALILWGWALAQFPYIVEPDLTFYNTAAPDSVLLPVLIALIIGLFVLIPSFWYLYSIFKGERKPTDVVDTATTK